MRMITPHHRGDFNTWISRKLHDHVGDISDHAGDHVGDHADDHVGDHPGKK